MSSNSISKSDPDLAMQFDDVEQQHDTVRFGIWIFLATEVLFFGGMIVAYVIYRFEYFAAFFLGSFQLNLWFGGLMTAILLSGSLLVAMSDHSLEHDDGQDDDGLRRLLVQRLLITAGLGVGFLGFEFYEYSELIADKLLPGAAFDWQSYPDLPLGGRSLEIFFLLFFCMTGLHAIHMVIGISLVGGLAIAIYCSDRPHRWRNTLMVIGLYWHFVDIVWIFLYPLFYLVR